MMKYSIPIWSPEGTNINRVECRLIKVQISPGKNESTNINRVECRSGKMAQITKDELMVLI